MVEKEFDSEWLMKFEATQIWIESLERRRGKPISVRMTDTYMSRLRGLIRFFRAGEYPEANPNSILKWANSVDPDDVMTMLNNHSLWLQGIPVNGYEKRVKVMKSGEIKFPKMSESSANSVVHATIRGFFTHNKLWLPKSSKKSNGRSETKKNDENFAIFKVDPDSNMIIGDYSQLRYFLGFLTARDKLIAQSLLSTSQDSIDLLGLTVGFVRSQGDRSRLLWEGTRTKTGEEFRTFFSRTVTEDLKRYVGTERAGAKDTDPLFVSRDKVSGMNSQHITDNFLKAARSAGFVNGDTQHPFRPKRMRSIFASAYYQAKIVEGEGPKNVFMGHASSIGQKYRNMPAANLEQIYAKVEPFLSVYSEGGSDELVATRQKSEQALDLALDLREENKNLRKDVEDLKEMVMGLNAMVTALDEQLNEFRDSYQTE